VRREKEQGAHRQARRSFAAQCLRLADQFRREHGDGPYLAGALAALERARILAERTPSPEPAEDGHGKNPPERAVSRSDVDVG
jgi:hypothetical protein